eukprot:UN07427
MEFILKVNIALRGKNLQDIDVSILPPQYDMMTRMFNELYDLIDEFPPYQQNQRFGNVAYRDWYDAAQNVIGQSLQNIVITTIGSDDGVHNEEIAQILAQYKQKMMEQHRGNSMMMMPMTTAPWASSTSSTTTVAPQNQFLT